MSRNPVRVLAKMLTAQQMLCLAKSSCQPGAPAAPGRITQNAGVCLLPTCSGQSLQNLSPSHQRNAPSLLSRTAQGCGNTSCGMEGPCLQRVRPRALRLPPSASTTRTASARTDGWPRLPTACRLASITQRLPTKR